MICLTRQGEYRNSITNSSLGPIKKIFELYCDIIDETGGIATIATILANKPYQYKKYWYHS